MRFLFKLFLVVLLAAGAWFAYLVTLPVTPKPDTVVILKPGWSSLHIARELQEQGVIRDGRVFLLWRYAHPGKTLKAGEYGFDNAASAAEVYRKLVRGEVLTHTVVVPEGFTIWDIAGAFEAAKLGSRQGFLAIMQSGELIADLDPQAASLEGYLFPDTYEFTRSQSPRDMVAAMVGRFRKEAAALGLTAAERKADMRRVVTLASIVEKETPVAAERGLVASVYANRLAAGIALDADPTVIYAHLLRGDYSGALHHDDLEIASPYNTYRNAGMPPGPIGSPGRESLKAAMKPAESDFLYFVADGDGNGHSRFAKTLEEHNANVNLYRRAVRQMNR